MSEYIDRESIFNEVADSKFSVETDGKENEIANLAIRCYRDTILARIRNFPAADVRHVVLCKNCKHNMANIVDIQDGININGGWNACQLTELYDDVEPDDFCSRGMEIEGNK